MEVLHHAVLRRVCLHHQAAPPGQSGQRNLAAVPADGHTLLHMTEHHAATVHKGAGVWQSAVAAAQQQQRDW